MGYYMQQTAVKFIITKANIAKVLVLLRSIVPPFCRIPLAEDSKTVEDAFWVWRWKIYFDETGNINSIHFGGEKEGEEDLLFQTIAPLVGEGSYIQMLGEDGAVWRYCFENGTMLKRAPIVLWPKAPPVEWWELWWKRKTKSVFLPRPYETEDVYNRWGERAPLAPRIPIGAYSTSKEAWAAKRQRNNPNEVVVRVRRHK
jgi:hypothetical protein